MDVTEGMLGNRKAAESPVDARAAAKGTGSAIEEQINRGSDSDEREEESKGDGVGGNAARDPRASAELADGTDVVLNGGEVDDDAEGDERDSGTDRNAGMAGRRVLVGLKLPQEEAKAGERKADAHQPEAGADPREEGSFGGEIRPRVLVAGRTGYGRTRQFSSCAKKQEIRSRASAIFSCKPPMQFALLILLFLQPWPQPAAVSLAQANATDAFAPLRQEWADDLHAKKIDAALALYSPDATFINPDGSRAHGSDPIRKLFQWAAQTYDSDLSFHPDRVEQSGMLAVDSGTYTETLVLRATGKQQVMSGSYLMVYRREAGTWKILEQEWTSKAPQ